jgi:hypothetical protein
MTYRQLNVLAFDKSKVHGVTWHDPHQPDLSTVWLSKA